MSRFRLPHPTENRQNRKRNRKSLDSPTKEQRAAEFRAQYIRKEGEASSGMQDQGKQQKLLHLFERYA